MEQLPDKLPGNPLVILARWLQEATADDRFPNPDAMTLATVDADGRPAARVVLCKEIAADPGYLVFYTNYDSAKGAAIKANHHVAATFHWDKLNRQARVEGIAIKSPAAESDRYFASRDKESRVGAWTSSQSQPIESRQHLMNKHAATTQKLSNLALDSGINDIPRPPFWGGYRIWVNAAELWVRGQARLHDRGRWERPLTMAGDQPPEPGDWIAVRLQP